MSHTWILVCVNSSLCQLDKTYLTPSISQEYGFVTALRDDSFPAVVNNEWWSGCCGRWAFAGSFFPGMISTLTLEHTSWRNWSNATIGEASYIVESYPYFFYNGSHVTNVLSSFGIHVCNAYTYRLFIIHNDFSLWYRVSSEYDFDNWLWDLSILLSIVVKVQGNALRNNENWIKK